jgi:hypothetical protein
MDSKNSAENMAEAINNFVERHERSRLRKHTARGNINGMENFLDILTAMVRLLYTYYARGLGLEHKSVTDGQIIGWLINFVEIATGGISTEMDTCNGFLMAISENLEDPDLLQEASDTTNFAGNIGAVLMIAQKVRFNPNELGRYGPAPKRPRECLPSLSQMVKKTFVDVGLAEPSKKDILEALEHYQMFTDEDMAGFQNELGNR